MSDGTRGHAEHAPDPVALASTALARKLIENIDRLRSAIGPQVVGQPVYASLHPEEAAEVVRTTHRIAETLTSCMAEGRCLRPPEARGLEELGRRRAELGIPLTSVIGAIEQGAQAGHELLEQHVSAWPDPRVALVAFGRMSRNLFRAVHETTALVASGYRDEEQERATHLVREQATFVEDLLGGAWIDSAAVIDTGRKLGFPLTDRFVLVLVLPETARDAPDLKAATARFVQRLGPNAITGPLRHGSVVHSVVLLALPTQGPDPSSLVEQLDVAAREAGVVALAEPMDDLTRVAACYEAMRSEAKIAAAVTRFACVLLRQDLLEFRVLRDAGIEAVFNFVDAMLGPLLGLEPAEALMLATTLEAVFATDDPTEVVAERLHLSHSGLRYRLRRITRLTALHWNERRARYRLQLGLDLYRLHEANLPALGDPRWNSIPAERSA